MKAAHTWGLRQKALQMHLFAATKLPWASFLPSFYAKYRSQAHLEKVIPKREKVVPKFTTFWSHLVADSFLIKMFTKLKRFEIFKTSRNVTK